MVELKNTRRSCWKCWRASLFLDNLGKTLENIFKAALTFDGKKFK